MNARPLIALTVVAGLASVTTSTVLAQEYSATIGHLESDGQSRHIHLQQVADLVSERTDGAVAFEIFPSGQLGNQRQMTEGVQLGTIQGTVSPAAFLGGFNPAVSILDIPYLMPEDPEVAQQLREGPFGQALLETFSERSVVAIAWWPNGLKNFTSNEPLDDISDFAGQKFRVMDSSILIRQFEALGASAIALPFGELYTSLQTGVVDGQENPLDTINRMRFDEVQQHLVVSEHGAMEDIVMFNPAWWNGLPAEYQDVITQAFLEVIPDLRAHKAEAIAASLEEIVADGTSVRVADADERAAFREAMFEPASAAYLANAGDEGAALMELYLAEYETLTQ